MLNIFWFRRDLRLEDNTGLFHALSDNFPVLPVFIFDENILRKLQNPYDARVKFIYDEIYRLKVQLEATGSSLMVKFGKPEHIFQELINAYTISTVFANHDYEPYSRERDEEIGKILKSRGIRFLTYKDQVIFEKDEVVKDSGNPYTVFTPYSRKWKNNFFPIETQSFPSEKLVNNFLKTRPFVLPNHEKIGFKNTKIDFTSKKINLQILENYHKTRDYPSLQGTSRLGIHLRFGTISIRELVKIAIKINEVFLNELIWREFYMMILWHFPKVADQSFKPQYDLIGWRNNETEFAAWCEGKTGYLFVDAGMRELNQTGYMHNRLRMVTASFLTKHLLIDWRWGEAWFAKKLLDYEMSSNNGGWQWTAGTGCDAAPYFRVFNPDLQMAKFDPEKKFIRKWVPEYNSDKYPRPIVDHSQARNNAISAYKKALERKY